jgi:hypothetical protein
MKRIALGVALVALLLVPGALFAQNVNWDGWWHKGDMAANAGVGFAGGGWGWGFAVYPGFEFEVADWKIADTVPLSLGVSARGMIGISDYYGTAFGAGPFVAAHMGFKGLDIPEFFQKLDLYVALGLAVSFGGDLDFYGVSPVGFASYDGISYFVNDKVAIYLEGNYWGYYGGATLGVLFKLK